MYNHTEASKNTPNTSNININKSSINIHRVGKSILGSSAELNLNSPNKLITLKSKQLENNINALNVNSEFKKIMVPVLNNKSPILMKDKMRNLPGVITFLSYTIIKTN